MAVDTTAAGTATGLRANAIGLREVLFQSITGMAPGAAVAASIPAGAGYAGGSLPLAVVFALIACLLSASSIGLLAREMPAAGSLATYAARGVHPAAGFLTAWGYVLVSILIPPLVLFQLGFTVAGTINSEWSSYPANLWWPWAILGALIVLAAGFYGIRTSARMGTILGVSEIAVFLVLAVFFIVHAGGHNTLSVFGTGHTPSGYKGITGVIAGSVYTVLAFGGFEGAAPLAEESRNPKRTVQKAVLFSTLGIGIFYVFTTYAADVAFGPAGFSTFTSSGAASWEGMARSLYGLFWFFVFLAIVNSTIGNANAGVNIASRMSFAMGRIGAFPAALARVHPKHRSPVLAIVLSFVLTVAVLLGLGLRVQPGERVRDDRHRHRDRARGDLHPDERRVHRVLRAFRQPGRPPVERVPAPHRAGAGHRRVRARLADRRGHQGVLLRRAAVAPASYMGPGVAGFMVLGIIYLGYLYAKHPRTVTEVGLVHLDEPASGVVTESTVTEGGPADERP